MFLEGWRITRHWCRCPAAPMHQQYLSIQDTHAPALANTRNPRMRYTRAPRRGLIVASQFFSFFIKIIVASWDTAISGWPTEKRTDSDKEQRKHKQPALQVSSKRAIGCFMLCVHVCHETTTVTDPIVFYFLRITARLHISYDFRKTDSADAKIGDRGINPGVHIQRHAHWYKSR